MFLLFSSLYGRPDFSALGDQCLRGNLYGWRLLHGKSLAASSQLAG